MAIVRVYEVDADVDHFQYLLPISFRDDQDQQDRHEKSEPKVVFDGAVIDPTTWQPPAVYSSEPNFLAGDFWGYGGLSSSLVISPRVMNMEAVRNTLAACGQVFPLPYHGDVFGLVNVTTVADALDHDRSDWVIGQRTRKKILLTSPVFRTDALPSVPLFKLPRGAGGGVSIWATEGVLPVEQGFKHMVERLGLKGLLFKEVWSAEGTIAPKTL